MNVNPKPRETNNCFVVIADWMIDPGSLNLKGTDAIIYAVIYGFSQHNQGHFTGGMEYLAYWAGCTTESAARHLKSLVERGFIIKGSQYGSNYEYVCNRDYTPLNPTSKETKPKALEKPIEKIPIESLDKGDWNGLICYFEQNRTSKDGKRIPPYTEEGRKRQTALLKKLSKGCWSYAVDAITFALDNHYIGFANGTMFFRGDLDVYIAREMIARAKGQTNEEAL